MREALPQPDRADTRRRRVRADVRRRERLAAGARERLLTPLPRDLPWGWLGPLLVAAFAGLLRFHRLGVPPEMVFDEVYYASQAADLLDYGVEYDPEEGAPEYVVHPPVGKWVIALGQLLLERDAFGWRFMVALLGTLSVLMLARIGRRLFRSTLLGCAAGLLLAVDGMHFVHSRMALLDLILMFFALGAFGALLVDRDRTRERLASTVERLGAPALSGFGPGLGLRPWRLGAGVLLGLAVGTKWSGLFFLAAFGLLTVLWDLGARRAAGVERPWAGTLVRDAWPAFFSLVGVALVVYLASWTGWFTADPSTAYARDWAETQGGGWPLVPSALQSLLHYHDQALGFHETLSSPHNYESNPWGWLVLARSTSVFYEGLSQGQGGCEVESCAQAITALGTPALWWAATLALPVLLVRWAGARDWRAGAVLAGVAAGYLPWFAYQERTIFSFYTVAFVPWLVLAVVLVLGLVLGPRDASPARRATGAAVAGSYVALVVVNFAWLYPVLAAVVIPYAEWADRMWWPSWI